MRPAQRPLGLIGGMSWRSTALYYNRLNLRIEQRTGAHRTAVGLVATVDFAQMLSDAAAGDWHRVEKTIVDAGKLLQNAGCQVVALTAVTSHLCHAALEKALEVPVPHVLDASAKELNRVACNVVGVLGTSRTCAADFTRERLSDRGNRKVLFLPPQQQALVNRMIDEHLTVADVHGEDRSLLVESIAWLKDRGADAVLLADRKSVV